MNEIYVIAFNAFYTVLSRLCMTGVQGLECNQIKEKSKYVHTF
jgi:hypothetical protein